MKTIYFMKYHCAVEKRNRFVPEADHQRMGNVPIDM